jgi:hypothetical protein
MTVDTTKIMKTLLEQWPLLQNFQQDITIKKVSESLTMVIVKLKVAPKNVIGEIPVAVMDGKIRPPAVIVTKAGPMPITESLLNSMLGTSPYKVASPLQPTGQATPTNPLSAQQAIVQGQMNPMMGLVRRASAPKKDLTNVIKLIYKDSKGWHMQQSLLGPSGYMKRTWKLGPKQLSIIPAKVKEEVLKNGYAVLEIKKPYKVDKLLKKKSSAPVESTYQHIDLCTLKPKNDYIKVSKEGWGLTKKAGIARSPNLFYTPSDESIVVFNNKYASAPTRVIAHYRTDEVGKEEVYELSNGTKATSIWLSPIYKKAAIVDGVLLANPKSVNVVPINPSTLTPDTRDPKVLVGIRKLASDTWEIDYIGRGTLGDAAAIYEWFKTNDGPLRKIAADVPVNQEDAQQMQQIPQQSQQPSQSNDQTSGQEVPENAVENAAAVAKPVAEEDHTVEDLIDKLQQIPTKAVFAKLVQAAALAYIRMILVDDVSDSVIQTIAHAVISLGKIFNNLPSRESSEMLGDIEQTGQM